MSQVMLLVKLTLGVVPATDNVIIVVLLISMTLTSVGSLKHGTVALKAVVVTMVIAQ